MKLVLQVAIGVFIGAFGSQYAFEQWRSYETQKAAAVESQKLAEQKRRRDEQGARIRELVIQGLRERGLKTPHAPGQAPLDQERQAE